MPGPGRRNDEYQTRKVFIGGLNYNSTEESLKEHFSKFGELVDVVVMKFPDTKRSRGFGFVTYATDEGVDACQANRPHEIDGKTVETKRATPREEIGRPEAGVTVKKLFVGGIKDFMEDEQIKEYFEQFGNVVAVIRMNDKESGKTRGFCFVEFDDHDPVDKAMLKGHHEINGKHIDIRKAVSKEEMGGGRMGGGRGGFGRGGGGGGGKPFGGRGGPPAGGRGGWGGAPRGRGNFQGGGNSWGGPGGWNAAGGEGWGNGPYQGGGGAADPTGWGGNDYYQPTSGGGWGGNTGYGGAAPPEAAGGYNQGGFNGGPMRPTGAAGGYRTAPYGGGPAAAGPPGGMSAGGFRGGRGGPVGGRGGPPFRGGRM